MTKINRFCAECGEVNKALYENFCQDCYWKFHSLAKPKSKELEFTICNECYSVKLSSGWTYLKHIDETPSEIANSSIKFLNIIDQTYVDIHEITHVDWMNPKPKFTITYEITSNNIEEFDEHREYHSFDISIGRGTCKVCVSKKSGSASTIVQLRAKNRNLSEREIKKYSEMAFNTSQDQISDNPKAYLSDIVENHGGLDYYFGSSWTAENFISTLQKLIVGHKEKNFKLITEDKKGQRVYSVTYLFRIPEVKPRDVIEHNNELHKVVAINNKSVVLRNLVDKTKSRVYDWNTLTKLREQPEECTKIILSKDYATNCYLLMDNSSFESEEVNITRFHRELEIGSEIKLLKWKNKYYLPL
ncbi:MAG: NMD3-related protein [Candidatus Kariarchaeaceae archaeon]|jgi:nonsense-mediated mRNA decay protein 3